MKKIATLSLLLFFVPAVGQAATGDLLFNCTFDGSGSSVSSVVSACGANGFSDPNFTHASVATGGHDGGKYVNWYYPNNGAEIDELFTIPVGRPEITLVYWEKFDKNASVSGNWNVKSTRAYTNSAGSNAYIGAMMSRWGNGQWQQGVFYSGTMTKSSAVTYVTGPPDYANSYCTYSSGNTYNCGNGSYGAVSVLSSPSLRDTAWHKVRIYYKMPSSTTSSDGITTLWIDETQIYSITNMRGTPSGYTTWSNNITHITVHPSDDFFSSAGDKTTFNHGFDDITVYEGYVPPSGTTTLSAPPLSQPSYAR